jgi:hypothetical protein
MDLTLTGEQANFLLDVAIARSRAPSGVPVAYARTKYAVAKQCERAGLIERHYLGTGPRAGQGALLTERGLEVVSLFKAR